MVLDWTDKSGRTAPRDNDSNGTTIRWIVLCIDHCGPTFNSGICFCRLKTQGKRVFNIHFRAGTWGVLFKHFISLYQHISAFGRLHFESGRSFMNLKVGAFSWCWMVFYDLFLTLVCLSYVICLFSFLFSPHVTGLMNMTCVLYDQVTASGTSHLPTHAPSPALNTSHVLVNHYASR